MAGGNRGKPDGFTLSDSGENSSAGSTDSKPEGGNSDSVGNNSGAVDPARAAEQFDNGPEFTGGTNKDGSPTKKRGRKAGPRASTPKQDVPQDIGSIQALLIGIHSMIALRVPEMAIEESEAKTLAEAIARVERHYPTVAGVLTGKIADHVTLMAALGTIYGTRFAAIKMRKAGENAKPVNTASVIHPAPFMRPAE